MNDIVSVIIPVHNAAPYLAACLDSVLNQSYPHLQVIAIDDGSTDESGSILAAYAARDHRLQLHTLPHEGVSAARNLGIEQATGTYLTFVDADDLLTPFAIEMMVKAADTSKADVVIGNYITFRDDDIKMPVPPTTRVKIDMFRSEETIVRTLLQRDNMDSSVCAKLYARRIFRESLRFNPGRFEDLDIIYRIYTLAHRVARIKIPVYLYRRHQSSFISSPDAAGRFDALDVCQRMSKYTQMHSHRVKRAVHVRTLAACFNTLALLRKANLSRHEHREMEHRCFKYLKSTRRAALRCSDARRRDRMGALLAYMPRSIVKMIIRHHNPYYS